jgi:hypothetical protein
MYRSFICNVKYFIKLLNNSKIKKMKKLLLIAFLSMAFAGNAQTQVDLNAKKVSESMTTVMGLSSEETSKAYDLISKRNKDKKALKEKFGDDVEGFKTEGKEVEQQFNKDMKDLVGNEKWKIWADFKKAENEAKAKN